MFGLSKVFVRGIPIGLTLVALAFAGGITSLQATPVCTPGETINLGAGMGSELFSNLGPGVCVQSQDALFGNFNLAGLPSDGSAQFQFQNLGTNVRNSITFLAPFAPNSTYTFGYDVETLVPDEIITALLADFTQTTGGPTMLSQTTTPTGTGTIDLSKTNNIPSGNNSVSFASQNLNDLVVEGTLATGTNSDTSAVLNSITEPFLPPTPTPEPAALEVLGIALAGFGAFRLRRKA